MEEILNNRVSLAHLPTPIQYFPRLSEQLGIELYIKRDDLTESIASGNKIRKMEYVVFDAKNQGADTLVSCGGIQSNHCRAVAWVAAKMGFDCLLLLRGEVPKMLQGNLLLDRLLGAEVRFYTPEDFKKISEIAKQICAEIEAKGQKPYYIPIGASTATGSLGYVRMVKEVVESGHAFDHIYCALGSGGTFAGILLGCQYFHLPGKIHGIAVCDDISYFVSELTRIREEFETRYNLTIDLSHVSHLIDDGHVGLGYALNTESEWRNLIELAQTEGLVLDPVYTLKTFLGLMEHARKGLIKPGERVLFVHSGGHYGLFLKHDTLEKLIGLSSNWDMIA
jgi:D-cysteine desulfhydrase